MMNGRKSSFLVLVLALVSVVAGASEDVPVSPLSIEVVLSDKLLHVRLGEQVIRSYPVAIGKMTHPTPEGEFLIEEMIWNPWWYPPDSAWADGLSPARPGQASNPMRIVKIPFDSPFYYIHGTDRPESLGTLGSHGCIRVSEQTARELGRLVMRYGGHDRSEEWYRRVLGTAKEQKVELDHPVRITIRMGDSDVYPGVVWAVE